MKDMQRQLNNTNIPWRMLAWLFLLSFVLALFYITRPVPFQLFRVISNLIAIFYPILLASCCFRGSRRFIVRSSWRRVPRSTRRFSPLLLGLALLCFTVAQVVWFYDAFIRVRPPAFPSLQHFLFLGMYPFYIAAFLCLPSQNLSRFARLRLLFDSLIVMTVVTTLLYYFLLAPLLIHGKGTPLEKGIASIFTWSDQVLLFCLLLVALRFGETALRPVLILLALGVLSLLVTDAIHLAEVLAGGYNRHSVGNTFLLLTGILVTGAAQTVRRLLDKAEPGGEVSAENVDQIALLYPGERLKAFLPSLLVLAFSLLILGIYLTGANKSFAGQIRIVYLGGFLALFLIIVRQMLTMYGVNMLQGELQNKNRSLHLLNERLAQQSVTDPLTGLPNHRVLVKRLDEELALAQREASSCALLFLDVDHFKVANDRYGHLIGDTILCQFGALVKSNLRASDCVGRWRG